MRIVTADAGRPPRNRIAALLADALASPFPPSKTDTRLLGSDWSHFNGLVDIGKHIAYNDGQFRFVVVRSGQGYFSSYDDVEYKNNAFKCDSNEFPWMQYHVLLPNQDVTRQVDHLYDLVNSLAGIVPAWIWWDVELVNEQSPKRISDATIEAMLQTKQKLGIEVGTYTGEWFSNCCMETQDWFSEIVWWLATWRQNMEHPGPPGMPETATIDQCMIHQTTSWGDGHLVGMESPRLDLNRWMWSEEKLDEIFGIEPQPPNGDLEQQVAQNTADIAALTEWAQGIAFNG